jgi:hypothetical protein
MRLLLDISVLLDVALQRPGAPASARLQVAAAMACGAQFIVTRNERDFRKSPVPALSPEVFLRRHGGE